MSFNGGEDIVTVKDLLVKVDKPKAYGVAVIQNGNVSMAQAGMIDAWIAKSQIESTDLKSVGSVGFVDIPRWMAEKNDLVYEE